MAVKYEINYKNNCTPQEYLTENSRWYLDSDVKKKLTGKARIDTTIVPVVTFTGVLGSNGKTGLATNTSKFIYLKNLGIYATTIEVGMSITDTDVDAVYFMKLEPGDAFASEIQLGTYIHLHNLGTFAMYDALVGNY